MREWSNGAILLGRLAFGIAIAAPFVWAAWKIAGKMGMLLAIVGAVPLVAKLITKHLIEVAHEGFSWLWHQPLKEWEGRFYAFDDVQVRIYEVDSELWFTLADVLKAIDVKRLPATFQVTHRDALKRIPGTLQQALPASGLPALLEPMRDAKAGRFLNWAQREVVAPWERRRGGARFGGAAKV